MKTKSILTLLLMLLALSFTTLSCKKDSASTHEEPEDPGITNCNDPSGTITANLRNDDGYITVLGGTLKMNSADNFVFDGQQYHERTIVCLGEVEGLGCVDVIPETGWSDQVAVIPNNGYVVKDKYYYFDYNIQEAISYVKYARIYVTRYQLSYSNTILGAELKYQDNWCQEPSVITKSVTNITQTSAESGGIVNAGGLTVTERGICWGKQNNPTIDNSHVYTEENTDNYTFRMTNLDIATTYYVRAYIKNDIFGIVYGNYNQTFTTLANPVLATVTTSQVTNVTQNSATCAGDVTDDGGSPVTERGICWNTTGNPTINGSHKASGSGVGEFSVELINLYGSTTYHIRAYAKNGVGVSYGEEVIFTTYHEWHNGMLPGIFSVSATKQVKFSQGNLQYQASTNTWRFASNQYDIIGTDNTNISSSYNGWIDLFGWGTSGWNNGNVFYHPYDSDDVNGAWYGPEGEYDLTGEYANCDWGVYNRISNGGNTTGTWRTLTVEEWMYLLYERSTAYDIRFATATISGICAGIIILPDDWSPNIYSLYDTNNGSSPYANIISAENWNILENAGAVFISASGYRSGTYVTIGDLSNIQQAQRGTYWTTNKVDNNVSQAKCFDFNGNNYYYYFSLNCNNFGRQIGCSVRLVHDEN